MTHEQIAARRQELKSIATENNRQRETLLENERQKHRDNTVNEQDRHRLVLRQIEAEAQRKADELQQERATLAIEEAKLRDLEMQARMQGGGTMTAMAKTPTPPESQGRHGSPAIQRMG